MKKYYKPVVENTDLTLIGRIMDPVAESGEGSQQNPTEVNEGMGLAPQRKVF